MAPNASKYNNRTVARTSARLLKPAIIALNRPKKMTKVSMTKKSNAILTPVMPISLPTRSQWPTLGTGPLKNGYFSRRN